MVAAHTLICAVLRREKVCWNSDAGSVTVAQFLAAARYHGVLPLLAMELGDGHGGWPEPILAASRDAARLETAYELARRAADMLVVAALGKAGAPPLILKGSALAYTLYSNPILRPRGDTDLLVSARTRSAAEGVLAKLGYIKREATEGEHISYQASWTRANAFGTAHHVDLHWRINNSQVLAKAAGYDELVARAVPVPALGPDARTLCPVDALLFACIHRIGHVNAPYFVDGVARRGIDRLIWLYDIDLLVAVLSEAERDEFAKLATAKRIRAICRDALVSARERLGTSVPPDVFEALSATSDVVEPSARYLAAGKARLMLEDFRALDHWSERVGWVRELAFPPARYMRAKYAESTVKWLPVLYARRGLSGVSQLIAPRRDDAH